MTFALKLKNKRFEYKLTQKELAEKLGVTTTSIGFVENGSRKPSKNLAIALSKFFKTSVAYWLEEDVTEENPSNTVPKKIIISNEKDYNEYNKIELPLLSKALNDIVANEKVTLDNLNFDKEIQDTLLNILKLEIMQKLQKRELEKLNSQLNKNL